MRGGRRDSHASHPSSFPAASLDAVQGRLVRGPRAKHTLRHSCVAGLDVRCDFVPSSGTGRRPHAQRASVPRDADPRRPSRRPLTSSVPLPSHFRGSRGHVHTPRLREISLLGHWGQSWRGSFKLEPLEEPRGAWKKKTQKDATLKMAMDTARVA